jgi:hypothetical protein
MGPIGLHIYIISGERAPSDTLERLNPSTLTWDLIQKTLPQKRGQSRAIFMPQHLFPGCPA